MVTKEELLCGGAIISATRSDEDFLRAVASEPKVIFDLYPDLMNVSAKVKKAHEAGKKYFLHMDLVKGVGKDESGMRFLHRIGVDGILSTKVSIIKLARESGIATVQRFFIVDSQSIHTSIESIKTAKPDMIEIMPGTVCKVIERLARLTSTPIIAGGLIETESELRGAIEAGALAASTGNHELWSVVI